MIQQSKSRLWAAALTGTALFCVLAIGANPVFGASLAQASDTQTLSGDQISAIVEHAAALLETSYVFPDTGVAYAAMLRRNLAAGKYAAVTDRTTLGQVLTADLQALAPDRHLRIRSTGPSPAAGPQRSDPLPPEPAEIAPGILAARWVAPGVAYISFRRFSDEPAAVAALTAFLDTHRQAKALVIDAREHRGGNFPMLGILCDRLFAKPTLLANMDIATSVVTRNGVPFPPGPELKKVAAPDGLTRFQHWSVPVAATASLSNIPVYYLTSHRTFSAAEHLAMVLKITGRATLIGEATGGGNHFGGVEDLGNGLNMFLPIGRTSNPATGTDWETDGVSPDIAVPGDMALLTALNLARSIKPFQAGPARRKIATLRSTR